VSGKNFILLVLDGVGVGATPDASLYGDDGSFTLRNSTDNGLLNLPYLKRLGIYSFLDDPFPHQASCGKLTPKSKGKSTIEGHWEMMGVVQSSPYPTYPKGFPDDIVKKLSTLIGRGFLWNKPASGTEIIEQLGQEHIETGKPILYTSTDSVMQIAAHEDVITVAELYEICRLARGLMRGRNMVGRIISRPFIGNIGDFRRTGRRRDFCIKMPEPNTLSKLQESKIPITGVGRIADIFPEYLDNSDNSQGNLDCLDRVRMYHVKNHGLIFANLEDFDMLHGHRRDKEGFARSLVELDEELPKLVSSLNNDDLLMIVSDHGCDPTFTKHTDHTREYCMLMVYMKGYEGISLGKRNTLADVGATILDFFDIKPIKGESVLGLVKS